MAENQRVTSFAPRIADWQTRAGRHGLPWQGTRDPYRIWLSEVMLQQTQASTVIAYYERFLALFPDVTALAAADPDTVMHAWAGLGYYARARNLQRCARILAYETNGCFPRTAQALAQLPGIGPSTAAAIAAFAFGAREPILDGNVKRILARYFGVVGDPSTRAVEQNLWSLAHAVLEAAPADLDMTAYTQGQMDLGALVCTRHQPDCARCPLNASCHARQHGQQHLLPTPRQRRARPERSCLMLILECQGHLLLHKHASPGIWGGLWGLPQFDTPDALRAACGTMGVAGGDTDSDEPSRLAGISHAFTHFRLHIEPWWLRANACRLPAPGPNEAWVPITRLGATALPAPLEKLLGGLYPPSDANPDEGGVN
ncbi:MAG: A/G-specific adenine glycosylase [Alcaligenaceae bacterium]|nr:A/G-specific adenine glycosylase [Alcaligenaceae bacterium]